MAIATTDTIRRSESERTWRTKEILLALLVGIPWLLLGLAYVAPRATPPPAPPVAIGRTVLEPAASGSVLRLALLDRAGEDTRLNGELQVRVQAANGMEVQFTRPVTPFDFLVAPAGSALDGRLVYSLPIPADAWLRQPSPGEQADVYVIVRPANGEAFTTLATAKFP